LSDEVPQLFVCRRAFAKPASIGVIGNDVVLQEFAIDLSEEVLEVAHLLLSQLTLVQTFLNPRGNGQTTRCRYENMSHLNCSCL
jgi:hypothetical protein